MREFKALREAPILLELLSEKDKNDMTLAWWRRNHARSPRSAILMRRVLSGLASEANIERVFSKAGKYDSNLDPDVMECFVMVNTNSGILPLIHQLSKLVAVQLGH